MQTIIVFLYIHCHANSGVAALHRSVGAKIPGWNCYVDMVCQRELVGATNP